MITTAARYTPLDVIHAAAVAITARGYYQPLTRQGEAAVPTVMDTEVILSNGTPIQRGDRALFARTAADLPGELPAAVLEWCRTGTAEHGDYRANLARAARAQFAAERDIPLLCSAVSTWQTEQRRAAIAAQAAADAEHSRHQGATSGPDKRITRTATVAAVIRQGDRSYNGRTQQRCLIKLRDADGNVYVWPARPRSISTLPKEGTTIRISGDVTKHSTYRGAAQTYLGNCRWKPAGSAE